MESLDNIKKQWSENRSREEARFIGMDVNQIIKTRIKKEKKVLFEYFWASYFWQFIIYASMTRLIIHFWGDWPSVLFCLAGILIYIPFTTVFIRKFTSMAHRSNSENLYSNLKVQWERMNEFFVFKRRFDWFGIPLSCFIITLVIFKLWVPGGWEMHFTGAAITFTLAISAFLAATITENRKRFEAPLFQLRQILEDMKEEI